MSIRALGVALLVGCAAAVVPIEAAVHAQEPEDSARSRLSFAQLTLGMDLLALPDASTRTVRGGIAAEQAVPGRGVPRLLVGGTHFWGWAEFYLAIPLSGAALGSGGPTDATWGPEVETSARLYAGPVTDGGVRPFVGVGIGGFSVRESREAGEGPRVTARSVIPSAGIVISRGDMQYEAGIQAIPVSPLPSPVDRGTPGAFRLPNAAFWIGAKWRRETTRTPEARARLAREEDGEARFRREGVHGGPFIGLGPTSAWALASSTHNVGEMAFLPGRAPNVRALEFVGGWHFPSARLSIALPFRRLSSTQRGFGVEQTLTREVVGIEALRFLGDYRGFVPFAGVTVGFERHRFREQEGAGALVVEEASRVRPGVVLGWDIRPTRSERWVLRTNLRYTPNASLDIPDRGVVRLPDFEFNFIEVVWHVGGEP